MDAIETLDLDQGLGMVVDTEIHCTVAGPSVSASLADDEKRRGLLAATVPSCSLGSLQAGEKPLGEWATRLLVRFRVGGAPRPPLTLFCRLLLEPEHFVMERAMLRGIKRRAEASAL